MKDMIKFRKTEDDLSDYKKICEAQAKLDEIKQKLKESRKSAYNIALEMHATIRKSDFYRNNYSSK